MAIPIQDSETISDLQADVAPWRPFPDVPWVRGGVSERDDGGLSWNDSDVAEIVLRRERYFQRLGFTLQRGVAAQQIHGIHVERVSSTEAGRGMCDPATRLPATDGLITCEQSLILCTFHADCAPVFYLTESPRAMGLAHAGWRGIRDGLPGRMLLRLTQETGVSPNDIRVAVGPMISTYRYEVLACRAEQFVQRYGPQVVVEVEGKHYLDLFAALVVDLLGNGLRPANIPTRPPCTATEHRYFSYRRDGPTGDAMLAWLTLP